MSKRDTRRDIVETASRLFYKKGYNLTGINEIIAEAGIAKATLYSHFRSKDDICIAYLQYKDHIFAEKIEDFCKNKEKGDQQILGLFDFLSEFYEDVDFTGCWCIRTVSELPQENEKIRAEIQDQKKGLIKIIEQLLVNNKQGYSEAQVQLIAKQIYLLYESAVAESYLHQEKWPIESARSICQKLLM